MNLKKKYLKYKKKYINLKNKQLGGGGVKIKELFKVHEVLRKLFECKEEKLTDIVSECDISMLDLIKVRNFFKLINKKTLNKTKNKELIQKNNMLIEQIDKFIYIITNPKIPKHLDFIKSDKKQKGGVSLKSILIYGLQITAGLISYNQTLATPIQQQSNFHDESLLKQPSMSTALSTTYPSTTDISTLPQVTDYSWMNTNNNLVNITPDVIDQLNELTSKGNEEIKLFGSEIKESDAYRKLDLNEHKEIENTIRSLDIKNKKNNLNKKDTALEDTQMKSSWLDSSSWLNKDKDIKQNNAFPIVPFQSTNSRQVVGFSENTNLKNILPNERIDLENPNEWETDNIVLKLGEMDNIDDHKKLQDLEIVPKLISTGSFDKEGEVLNKFTLNKYFTYLRGDWGIYEKVLSIHDNFISKDRRDISDVKTILVLKGNSYLFKLRDDIMKQRALAFFETGLFITDLHLGNVGYNKEGNLKIIDYDNNRKLDGWNGRINGGNIEEFKNKILKKFVAYEYNIPDNRISKQFAVESYLEEKLPIEETMKINGQFLNKINTHNLENRKKNKDLILIKRALNNLDPPLKEQEKNDVNKLYDTIMKRH